MRILFCNIVWMKKYQGITDSDKPKYFGTYVTEQDAKADIFNFSEYNGKCYGYVRNDGDLILPGHLTADYREEYENKDSVGGFLIVWCSFIDKNISRIVGWYKNAVIYKKEQYQPSFTNPEYELDYFFEADSNDCVLLPADQRTFKIEKSSKAGKGKGFGREDIWLADSPYAGEELIPAVITYIKSFEGSRENFVLTKEMTEALPVLQNTLSQAESIQGQEARREDFLQEGLRVFEQEEYLLAISWFNAALQIKESPDVLYYKAYCLYYLSAFDKARSLLEKSLEARPDSLPANELMAFCCDMTGDWEAANTYLERMLDLTSEDDKKDVIRGTISEMKAYLDAG
jgi:tetratricopeptide (TPR) repeat protein